MNFKKINNLTGWFVFFIAFATYFLTREARGSFWDCGEFVSCAYKMQLPHPPGAPLFTILGRFFIILFGNHPMTAANAVNTLNSLASAATILFLFWTVTHFARKMFVKAGEQLNGYQLIAIMGAGAVGGLAYTYCDSFWYSAGEGEVYALSSFFTALVFWAMLKWEHADEKAGIDEVARKKADRWIVFLFFMLGLAICIHLLGLLTIPAIIMIYYYRRYKVTTKGAIMAFLIGCAVTGAVQIGIIQYSIESGGLFDIFFVNSLHLPFFSGFTFYFLALAATVVWGMRFNEKNISKGKVILWFILFLALFTVPFFATTISFGGAIAKFLLIAAIGAIAGYFFKPSTLKIFRLSLWSFVFITMGNLIYITAMIRANADPSINMNAVKNPIQLVYYLSREQYGEAPLLYGANFAARPIDVKEGDMQYVQGKNRYIPIGRDKSYVYNSEDKQLFPRIWDPNGGPEGQFHAEFYAEWLNLGQDQQTGKYEAPTYADNIRWFFSYQMSLMYWRYFMWNFTGKQNDIEGLGNKRDGNWLSGISFIDNRLLGDQDKLPDTLKTNKSHNKLYFLPFLLGIVGCVYQFLKYRKDWVVSFLLFFFTGIAIVLYLNQPGNQPRERDYAYAGSFYAYAIWVGLAVVAFFKLAYEKEDKKLFKDTIIYGGILTFLIVLMSSAPNSFGDMIVASFMVAVLYVIFTMVVTYGIRAISSAGQNAKMLSISATVICMAAPVIMWNQEWDDHDRSKKTLAPDMAKDYLESCAPNAILFTFGDNDTYPLWYDQEVEGVRPDVRIINNSLLGIDWYINQLRSKVNDADGVDVIWSPEQIEGHNREYLQFQQQGSPNTYYDLYDVMKNVIGDSVKYIDPDTKRDVGPQTFPVKKFTVPVDTALVRRNGTVNPDDSVLSQLKFELPADKNALGRNDLIMLNIIAANGWKRPIYFTSPIGDLGFGQYLRKDGLTYRLVPIITKSPQSNWVVEQELRKIRFLGGTSIRDNNSNFMYNTLMKNFVFGGANKKGIYFDEENRRHLLDIRETFAEAAGNLADLGRKEDAQRLLNKIETGVYPKYFPYGLASRYDSHNQITLIYLEACYKAGMKDLAEKVRVALRKDLEQQRSYYQYIKTEKPDLYGSFERSEDPANDAMLDILDAIEKKYAPEVQTKQNINTSPPILKATNSDSAKKKDSSKQK